jgi:hypothetical protein
VWAPAFGYNGFILLEKTKPLYLIWATAKIFTQKILAANKSAYSTIKK